MLEIFVLVVIYRRFSRAALAKGRSRAWGWYAVGMWVCTELFALSLVDPAVFGPTASLATRFEVMFFGLAAGAAGLLLAWLVFRNLKPQPPVPGAVPPQAPDPGVVPPSPSSGTPAGMRAPAELRIPAELRMPIPPQHAVSATEPAPPGCVFTGYCEVCDKMVWLTPEQGCPEHGMDTVSNIERRR